MSEDMAGKRCLVTGATDGHGKAVAAGLMVRGADVVILGRSAEKTKRAQSEIARVASGRAPEIILADLSRRDDVENAIGVSLEADRPLDVIVNNAGLVGLSRRTNRDGIELTLAVNYLSHFQLTLGLLPLLRAASDARVVNICSDTYRIARLDLEDLLLERGYSMMKAYGRSKLAILYFTIELARRLEDERISVHAVDPGPVASNIGADNPGFAYRIVGPMIQALFPNAARAARTALLVATDSAIGRTTGGYFRSLKRRDNPLDFDPGLSRDLWKKSLELCRIEKDPLALLSAQGVLSES